MPEPNHQSLLDKIRLGEDSLLELKEVRFAGDRLRSPHRDSLADELAAFANASGGVCVLGVDDKSREVLGIELEQLDRLEDFLREICLQSIDPPLAPTIQRLELPGPDQTLTEVMRIDVRRSLFVHRSPGGYLHRVGSAKRQMAPEYLARLFQQRSQARLIRFDEQCVVDAELADLEPALCDRFRSPLTQDIREDLLVKLSMAGRDDTGQLRPTVAGVLMGSRDARRWIPNAYIQAVAYRGTEINPASNKSYQLDAKDFTGPLDAQVFDACRFVAKHMNVAAVKHAGREDLPAFSMSAVMEALVNAVAHRDYAIHGSKIRLRLFSDRLELYSPGAIANTMTIASMPYRQAARNEALTSLLAKCPIPDDLPWLETSRRSLMDKRGEGVPIILQATQAVAGTPAHYRLIDDTELLLTIPARLMD